MTQSYLSYACSTWWLGLEVRYISPVSLLHWRLGVEEVEVSLEFHLKHGERMERKTI